MLSVILLNVMAPFNIPHLRDVRQIIATSLANLELDEVN